MTAQLVEDAVEEILLRLSPDDPACLVRATAVCRAWRRVLTDAAFTARYRAFHRTPPVLGFLRQEVGYKHGLFVPTTSFRPTATDLRTYYVHDCRHGLVLLSLLSDGDLEVEGLVVWDPITGDQIQLPEAPEAVALSFFSAEVIRDRPGGSFLVVSLGIGMTMDCHAWLYSSKIGAWSPVTSIQFDYVYPGHSDTRSCFFADAVYFVGGFGNIVFRYDLVGRGLSVIDLPEAANLYDDVVLVPAEDGGLGFAVLDSYSLCLWSRGPAAAGDGVDAGWTKRRVIDLKMLLSAGKPMEPPLFFIGFADGANAIFVNVEDGAYAIDLKSLRTRKVSERDDIYCSFTYMCFYTPDSSASLASPRMCVDS